MDQNNYVSTGAASSRKSIAQGAERDGDLQGMELKPGRVGQKIGTEKGRARRSAKNKTIRGRKERHGTKSAIGGSGDLYSHPAPLFPSPIPSDDESLASTALPCSLDTCLADAEASDPFQAAYQQLCARRASLQEAVSSLHQENVQSSEKRQTVTGLKTELKSIQGDVVALKQTLKSLLGFSP